MAIFKDGKNVIVVGGGNSALTDALYLDSLGAHVTIVHRRDAFRAEGQASAERISEEYACYVEYFCKKKLQAAPSSSGVEKVKVEDTKTGNINIIKADAVFVAIGYEPNNDIAEKARLKD